MGGAGGENTSWNNPKPTNEPIEPTVYSTATVDSTVDYKKAPRPIQQAHTATPSSNQAPTDTAVAARPKSHHQITPRTTEVRNEEIEGYQTSEPEESDPQKHPGTNPPSNSPQT